MTQTVLLHDGKEHLACRGKRYCNHRFICALVASLAAFFNSCATLFTEDFYKPMKKGMSESHYVMVGRIATVVVVLLGLAWMPIMMNMGNLYSYLQDIQSLIAPAW